MAVEDSVAERVYRAIKDRLAEGAFRLGQHLDPGRLADELGVSTTPVREALLRLSAERLVVVQRLRGFHVARWSVAQLRALFAWRASLARLALETNLAPKPLVGEGAYPLRVALMLQSLCVDANVELALASANADDRLALARAAEARIWPDVEDELAILCEALGAVSTPQRMQAIEAYHQRRIVAAAEIRDQAILTGYAGHGA